MGLFDWIKGKLGGAGATPPRSNSTGELILPRFAGTPQRLWGRAVFDAPPADHLPAEALETAARALAAALSG